jgi:hypothetical protein
MTVLYSDMGKVGISRAGGMDYQNPILSSARIFFRRHVANTFYRPLGVSSHFPVPMSDRIVAS